MTCAADAVRVEMQPRDGRAGGTSEEDGAESWSSLLLDRGRGDSAARLRAAREHYEAGAISAILDVWRGARWAVLGGTALLVLLLVLHTLFLKVLRRLCVCCYCSLLLLVAGADRRTRRCA